MPSATSTQTNLCLAVPNGQLYVYQFLFGQVQTVNYQFVCSPRQNDKSQPASVRPAVPKMSYRRDIWSTVVDGSIKNGQPFWWNRQRHYSRGASAPSFLNQIPTPWAPCDVGDDSVQSHNVHRGCRSDYRCPHRLVFQQANINFEKSSRSWPTVIDTG